MGCGASSAAAPNGRELRPENRSGAAHSEQQPEKLPPLIAALDNPSAVQETGRDLTPASQPGEDSLLPAPQPAAQCTSIRGPTSEPETAQDGDEQLPASPTSAALPERIRTNELAKLCQKSHFDRVQVERLYELFKVISSTGDDDGLIDKSEFQRALGLKRTLFVSRMFALFDGDGDETITFAEFIAGLSNFTSRAKPEEKARFSFKMYDINGDGLIDREELGHMLRASIQDNQLNITREVEEKLLDDTFAEAQPATPGYICFDEYWAMVQKKPQLLEFMTIHNLNLMLQ